MLMREREDEKGGHLSIRSCCASQSNNHPENAIYCKIKKINIIDNKSVKVIVMILSDEIRNRWSIVLKLTSSDLTRNFDYFSSNDISNAIITTVIATSIYHCRHGVSAECPHSFLPHTRCSDDKKGTRLISFCWHRPHPRRLKRRGTAKKKLFDILRASSILHVSLSTKGISKMLIVRTSSAMRPFVKYLAAASRGSQSPILHHAIFLLTNNAVLYADVWRLEFIIVPQADSYSKCHVQNWKFRF